MAFDLTAKLSIVDRFTAPMRKATQSTRLMQSALTGTSSALSRIESAGRAASSAFKSIAKSGTGMGSVIKGVAGITAAYVGAHQAADMFRKAADLEQSQVTVRALFKGEDSKADAFFTALQDRAAETMYSLKDYQTSASALIPVSGRDLGTLDKMTKLSERLAAAVPDQGLGGASFALREMFSGDTTSIVERFNLPRQLLNQIKSLPLEQQLKGLDKILNDLGYTEKLVADQGKTSMGQFAQITGTLDQRLTNMVKGSLDRIKPLLMRINDAVSSGALDKYFTAGSNAIVKITEKAMAFASWIEPRLPKIGALFSDVSSDVGGLIKSLTGASDTAGIFSKAVDFVLNNFGNVKPILYGVAGGLAVATAAQWGMNVAMAANPVGLVVTALGALAGAGIYVYNNWEKVKNKTIELWDSLGTVGQLAVTVVSPFGAMVGAGIAVMKNWDSIKSGAMSLWSGVKAAFSSGVDYIIARINRMIDVANGFGAKIKRISLGDDVVDSPVYAQRPLQGVNPLMSNGWSGAPKKATGMNYVPHTMPIIAHRGEAILPAPQADEYRSGRKSASNNGGGPLIHIENMHVRSDADINRIAASLARELNMRGVPMPQ